MRLIDPIFIVTLIAIGQACADDKVCLGCHAMMLQFLSKEQGHPAMTLGCGTCHVDHAQSSATNRFGHFLTAAPSELCVTCHAEITKKEFVHEPVEKDWTLCHSPHASLKEGLRAQGNALCLECHSDALKAKFETNGPVKLFNGRVTLPPRSFPNLHLLALQNDRGHPVSNHPVLRKQDAQWPALSCIVCHRPHGADKSASLLVTETEDFVPLCERCHK